MSGWVFVMRVSLSEIFFRKRWWWSHTMEQVRPIITSVRGGESTLLLLHLLNLTPPLPPTTIVPLSTFFLSVLSFLMFVFLSFSLSLSLWVSFLFLCLSYSLSLSCVYFFLILYIDDFNYYLFHSAIIFEQSEQFSLTSNLSFSLSPSLLSTSSLLQIT